MCILGIVQLFVTFHVSTAKIHTWYIHAGEHNNTRISSFLPGSTYHVVVVVTLTHSHYTMQSVVEGQAPITLDRNKHLGEK